jgi:hypothetical protein
MIALPFGYKLIDGCIRFAPGNLVEIGQFEPVASDLGELVTRKQKMFRQGLVFVG